MVAATLITARLGSSRLPRKPLRTIRGRTILDLLSARVGRASRPERVVLATTELPEDDELAAEAERLGIDVFRGEEDDILARWLGAAERFDADLLVCCDGDDVFCDAGHVDRVVEAYEATGADYITVAGLPFGAAPTGVSRAGLRRVCAAKTETDTAGQGRFFDDPRLATRHEVAAPEDLRHEQARMTLDYPEDLEFFTAVLDGIDADVPPLRDIVGFLHEHPEVIAINAGRQEEYWARFHALYPPVELGQ